MKSKKVSTWRVVLAPGYKDGWHVNATSYLNMRQSRTVSTKKAAQDLYDEIGSVQDIYSTTFRI